MKTSWLGSSRYLLAIPVATFFAAACGGTDFSSGPDAGLGGGGTSGIGSSAGAPHGGVGTGGTSNGKAGSASTAGASSGGTGSGGTSAHAGSGGTSSGGTSAHAGSGGTSSGGTSSHAGSGGTSSGGTSSHAGSGGTSGSGTSDAGAGGSADQLYLGPTVGTAKSFAVLAYSAITTANISTVIGDIGVSAGAVSTITGFDAPSPKKYGIDSLAPNSMRTMLAQQDVTALVGDIDPRPCDADYTNVVGGLTGDITLHPGVTCMNSFSADVLLNGHLTLDAQGNPNAFFVIRGNLTLTVADAAKVILSNGAQACGVFWRISKQVTIGKTVQFYGTVIAGTAITMSTASTLTGRALAQTAGVHLDANAISAPTDGLIAAPGVCTHEQ